MRLITGMHRSGTSLVARLVYEAGGVLGDPGEFYPADRWNALGYYEQPAIHRVNMPLVNGPWGRLSYLKLPPPGTVLRRAERLSERITKTAADFQGAVVKDPRFCLTLPAWLRFGARVDSLLICLREPEEVAQSLYRRNRLPRRLALRLWREHNERILKNCRRTPHGFVQYSYLLDPEKRQAEARRALRVLGLDLNADAVTEACSRSIRPEMNHSDRDLAEIRYASPVEELWNELRQLHGEQARRFHPSVSQVAAGGSNSG